MRYQPEDRAGHANIFLAVHGRAGYGLDLLASHELRLLVNGEMVASSSTYDAAHRAWTFFATTYDAQQAADNVRFYLGGLDQPVRLVGTQTLAAGSTAARERVFSIGGAPGGIPVRWPAAGTAPRAPGSAAGWGFASGGCIVLPSAPEDEKRRDRLPHRPGHTADQAPIAASCSVPA